MLGWWRGTKPQILYPQSASLNSNLVGASTWCFSVPLILGLCWQRSEQFEHQLLHGLSWLLVLMRFRDMGTAYGKHSIPELGFGCTWGWELGRRDRTRTGLAAAGPWVLLLCPLQNGVIPFWPCLGLSVGATTKKCWEMFSSSVSKYDLEFSGLWRKHHLMPLLLNLWARSRYTKVDLFSCMVAVRLTSRFLVQFN